MAYTYGISVIKIEKTTDGGTTWTQEFSGVATSISVDTSVTTKELRGALINDDNATFSIYPRDVIASSADATVKVELSGVNADDVTSLLQATDLDASWRITFKPANATTDQVIDNLKLTSKSGNVPYDDYGKITLEFKQVVTA
jgi:hypothetical protein